MKYRLFVVWMVAVMLMSLAGIAAAQSVDLPVVNKSFDIGGIVKNLAPCGVLGWDMDKHSVKLAGALYTLPWSFHDKAGTPYVEPTPGFAWSTDGEKSGQGGPIFLIGLRADNLYARMLTNQWLRDHYTSPKMPYLKLGPFAGYINRIGFIWGGMAAVGFGGK